MEKDNFYKYSQLAIVERLFSFFKITIYEFTSW
jgi:hypothetical protein